MTNASEAPGSVLEGLRAYFSPCPLLQSGAPLRLFSLDEQCPAYALEVPDAGDDVLRRYLNGCCVRRLDFLFVYRAPFLPDAQLTAKTARFFHALSAWIERQPCEEGTPALPAGCMPRALYAMGAPRMAEANSRSARFEMRCRLVYDEQHPNAKGGWLP